VGCDEEHWSYGCVCLQPNLDFPARSADPRPPLMIRLLRVLVYAGLIFAAWKLAAWWAAVLVAILCAAFEIGIALWMLADRAEKRLGKRE